MAADQSFGPRDWLFGVVLFAAVLLAYQPVWQGQYLWDDDAHVTKPELRSVHGLYRIWFELGATQQYYPLLHSAFWVEHKLWGDATLGYHLVNILLHGIAALMVALILRRLKIPGAYLAAAVFALHPVHVESVAWITEQKNTLSAVFYLGAAMAYLHFDQVRKTPMYLAAFAMFGLGLLCKTVTATLPAALLVIFWWQRGRLSWRRDVLPLTPFFMVGATAGVITAWVERKLIGAEGAAFELTVVERCLIAGRAIWFYLGKLLWPAELTFVYPRWQVSQIVWWQYLFPAAALALLAVLWLLRHRWRGPLAGVLFFVGTLFPALGFCNVYPFLISFVADHFQYLASLGIITLVSAGIALLLRRLGLWNRSAGYVLCLMLLTVLAGLTWRQSVMYADVRTLYETTIQRNPECWMAHNNLGSYWTQYGQFDAAIAHLQKALEIKPDFAEAHNNLGLALTKCRRLDEAMIHFQKALKINPDFAGTYNNYGLALIELGRFDEGMAQYQKALEIEPSYPDVYYNLGLALASCGRLDDAIVHYRKALEIRPDYPEAHNNLANVLSQRGQGDDAIFHYREALKIKPDYNEAQNNLGLTLAEHGRLDDAIVHFQKALELKPDFAEAHNNFGLTLAECGRFDDAIVHYRKALEIKPDYVEVYNNLGNALTRQGQIEAAIQQYQKALEIKPDDAKFRNNLAMALAMSGQFREALVQFRKTLEINPDYLETNQNLAWLLAACSDASIRDGAKAVGYAQRAVRLSGGKEPTALDTLAVAYAEMGQFSNAIKTGQQALDIAVANGDAAQAEVLRARIKLYQAGTPYHIPAAASP
jgi:tetratricopeptide (TPR) repeat protein